jgi:hypothetical protein
MEVTGGDPDLALKNPRNFAIAIATDILDQIFDRELAARSGAPAYKNWSGWIGEDPRKFIPITVEGERHRESYYSTVRKFDTIRKYDVEYQGTSCDLLALLKIQLGNLYSTDRTAKQTAGEILLKEIAEKIPGFKVNPSAPYDYQFKQRPIPPIEPKP